MIDQYPSPNGVLTSLIWRKTAAGGETSLSGYDNASQALSYTPGQEQVYLNGILLVRGDDYTATNGTSITGLAALTANDFVQINCYNNFSVATLPTSGLTGTISNAQLQNSSITINGSPVSLGGSVSLPGDIESVTASSPLTGGGTSGALTVGIQSASTTQSGAVQLTDSTSSTSTTTAATPNSVKTAYDLANAAIPKSLTTITGDIIYASGANTPTRLGIGSDGQVLTVSSGVPTWSAASGGVNIQTFTSNGTFTVPAGKTIFDVYVLGGGGGGGSGRGGWQSATNRCGGAGGGGGAIAIARGLNLNGVSTVSVTIGSGGNGGAGVGHSTSSGNSGSSGNTSSFGSYISAGGGGGGGGGYDNGDSSAGSGGSSASNSYTQIINGGAGGAGQNANQGASGTAGRFTRFPYTQINGTGSSGGNGNQTGGGGGTAGIAGGGGGGGGTSSGNQAYNGGAGTFGGGGGGGANQGDSGTGAGGAGAVNTGGGGGGSGTGSYNGFSSSGNGGTGGSGLVVVIWS